MDQENNSSPLEQQLTQAIYESLSNHIPSNATFLAERLLAQKDSQQNRALLAQCYMAQNKHYKVFYVLRQCTSEMNKYKFALSCVKINKLKDAQKSLLGLQIGKPNKNYNAIPNGSYGLYLMGVITQKQQRYTQAKDYFYRALELNPTLWSAYQKIGKLGQNIMPNKIFNQNKIQNIQKRTTTSQKRRKQDQSQNSQKLKKSNLPIQLSKKRSMSSTQNQLPNIINLLKKLADGYYQLYNYNCQKAIQQFKKLPSNHLNTGWVLTNMGRAYMEIVRYQDAANLYQQAFKLQPYRMEGIQHYSSCLWHLKKPTDLCYLAHQSLDKSLFVPEAWIAVGNCFSLQKQHQQALKFFLRAIQLNPHNPYAYSLCGHENVYNEDFAKAKKMFEQALNLDPRHYSAWWGQGNIAYKQQRYDRAQDNFKKAISINPNNPVLFSFMGMTLAAKRQFTQALQQFKQSERLDPKNGLNKYQKANTLVKLQQYQAAIGELKDLQRLMPKQAPIPMLLGKIYKKLGQNNQAHHYFTKALDLESKDAQKIKGFIESLHNGNDQQMDI